MKNTFLTTLAVIATASFIQAADLHSNALPEFTVTAESMKFIDQRLEAVVEEQVAQTLAEPIPAKVVAEAKAMTQPRIRFALAKGGTDIVLLTSNNS